MTNSDKIFIEWSEYGSRTDSLAHAIGAKPVFIGKINTHRNILYSFFTYLPKSFKNFKIIKKNKSRIVFISNSNWVIALVNLIFSNLFGHKIVFDSHSCAFDHKFIKYPLFLSKYFAKKADLSIITNEVYYNLLTSIGAKALIISDIPYEEKLFTNEKMELSPLFNICYICTYSADEPYKEVFEAARKNEKVKVYVTGDYKKVNIDPNNYPHITFTGFLSNEEYERYLNSVDLIMTLTTRENTMQRAGSEAISVGKPLITSDTKMLRNYFKSGTIFVTCTSKGINDGFNASIKNFQILKEGILKLREERKKIFSSKLEILKRILEIK
jgi:glycosyltransferase involved in cell wall biosynthesis